MCFLRFAPIARQYTVLLLHFRHILPLTRTWPPQILGRFDRALTDVRARTGATLSVFPVYAPSESRWLGLNCSRKYALINIGFVRTEKAYKWTIVHELAHQRGHGHDKEFNREFQIIAELVDPSN